MAAQFSITAKCELTEGVRMTRIGRLFAQNDKAAHTISVQVTENGAAKNLPGLTATAYFLRADDAMVLVSGSVSGSTAIVTLPQACYEVPGHFSLLIKVLDSNHTTAIFWGDGTVTRSETDSVVDPERVVPDLNALIAKIDEMTAGTAAANAAAGSANTAAATANTAASGADTAAANANAAAANANAAAGKLENMDATASTLATGAAATARVSTVDGHYRITFGLPRGEKGETGNTGPAGSIETVGGTLTLSAGGWSGTPLTQTIQNILNVQAGSHVIVSPAPESRNVWSEAGVACTAQGLQTLTFTASAAPTADIVVNLLIF